MVRKGVVSVPVGASKFERTCALLAALEHYGYSADIRLENSRHVKASTRRGIPPVRDGRSPRGIVESRIVLRKL